MVSPFTPFLGTVPKVFVGRDNEIEKFKKLLQEADKRKPISILLTGIRCIGKTVLLKFFGGIAREKGFCPLYIGLDETANTPTKLAKKIYGKTKILLEDEFVTLRAKKLLRKIEPRLSVKINDLELQLSSSLKEENINENNFIPALGNLIRKRKVCIFTDETQSALGLGVSRFLVNSFYSELPEIAKHWVVIFSGTPALEYKILEATPADRAFQKMHLSNLIEKAVTEVLQNTVKGCGKSFSLPTCQLIYKETQGVPYYVQFFGDQIFNLARTKVIGPKLFQEKKAIIIGTLGETVFARRLRELERRGLYGKILVEFARLDRGDGVSVGLITKNIGSYAGSYVQELEAMGYLVRFARGRYKLPDELFRTWLSKQKK